MEENEFVENWTNIRDKYSNEMVDILLENVYIGDTWLESICCMW